MRFDWDPRKAAANLRTHRISFAEAVTIFEDDFALTREDANVVDEKRFVTLSLSNLGNLLVVGYAYPQQDVIRVISCWKANKHQRAVYEKGRS